MKKLFLTFLVLSLLFGVSAYSEEIYLECLLIKESKPTSYTKEPNPEKYYEYFTLDASSYEISSVIEESIEAIRKTDNGTSAISIHRYTLELIYYFYNKDAVYEGQSSPFTCKKLEQKI